VRRFTSTAMSPPHLLLLPPPPRPASRAALNAAYRTSLTSVITKLRLGPASPPATLVIGLAAPVLAGSYPPRQVLWAYAQSLLAGLYTLVAIVCAEHGLATDIGAGPGSLDVRVVLVDYARGREYSPDYDGAYPRYNGTSVLDLAAFATHVRPWATLLHPSCEAGYELLAAFLRLAEGHQTFLQSQIVAIDAGLSLSTDTSDVLDAGSQISGYKDVCLGGTFDHLHPGHKLLLHATVLLLQVPNPAKDPAERRVLIVGVSADELLKTKKFADELQSWDQRARSVLSFLRTVLDLPASTAPALDSAATTAGPDGELHATFCQGSVLVRCVPLNDPFGPTIAEERIDAIAVSGETRGGGKAINDRRTEKGWLPLDVFEVDVLDSREVEDGGVEDFTAKISSTTIRQERSLAANQKPTQ
jgi:phosphopantetheine adenylyltransferase